MPLKRVSKFQKEATFTFEECPPKIFNYSTPLAFKRSLENS